MRIAVYERETERESYPFGLASAVHFSALKDGEVIPLNKNYGILFVKGEISETNTIIPLGVEKPVMFWMEDGSLGIAGRRIQGNGEAFPADGKRLWAWKTRDLIHFETLGLLEEDFTSRQEFASELVIENDVAEEALQFWNPAEPKKDETAAKFQFPLAKGYGDPVIFPWEGKWYYVSTNDNTDDVGIYVREADSVPGLFREGITEHLILPYDEERQLIQTFWAPEFHVIGEDLYLLFAVSGKQWGPQCHLMRHKPGRSIIDPAGWEDPIRVVKKDGTPLATQGITLDMTYVKAGRGSYAVWSYRENIGTPLDTGSMLYVASIDERQPWKLTSDPVLLSRPLFGWENLEGTINNEGPYAFIRDGKVYLTYSGGSANAYTYAVGLFVADHDADLLDLKSWNKSISPILSFYSVEEFGPGHNSFYVDENGNLMIAYHGETGLKEHLRCDMIRQVFFKKDGTPYFV